MNPERLAALAAVLGAPPDDVRVIGGVRRSCTRQPWASLSIDRPVAVDAALRARRQVAAWLAEECWWRQSRPVQRSDIDVSVFVHTEHGRWFSWTYSLEDGMRWRRFHPAIPMLSPDGRVVA